MKVKNIFWIYFERNDLNDLKKEKKNKILIRYLEENFSQNLKLKQAQINNLLKQHIINEKKVFLSENSKKEDAFQKIIRLKTVRDKLALDRGLKFKIDPIFEKIILETKNFARRKGSNLFVCCRIRKF